MSELTVTRGIQVGAAACRARRAAACDRRLGALALISASLLLGGCTRRPLETAPSRAPATPATPRPSAPPASAPTATPPRTTPSARGSGTAPVMPAPTFGALPTFERPNGTLLRPGVLTYHLSLARTGQPAVPLGERTVSVVPAATAGAATWLLVEARTGAAVATTDSLFVARSDLSPVRWWASNGPARLSASITRDTVYGASISYQGRRSFVVPLPPGALLTPGMVERVVEMLPLGAGYRAGASLLLVETGMARAVPAEISVEREERLEMAGRGEDCWVVLLRAGAQEERLWVAKSDARVVRTEQAVSGGTLIGELAR